MSWRYKKLKNDYNHDQMYDCSQSPKNPVCSSCYGPYTNFGKGMKCIHCCDEEHPIQDQGQTTQEFTNKFGFIDHVLVENGEVVLFDNGEPIPVCPQCMCHVMPNQGNGCLCTTCKYEFDMECEHDMHDEFLF